MRAGSGLAWFGQRLVIIQDDANFLAFVDPDSAHIEAIALPRGHQDLRQFDDLRGNKKHKYDLEACLVTDIAGAPTLIAFGSGSSRRREQIVVYTEAEGARVLHAPAFYSALRARSAFAGSELNVEGAALRGDTILLCNRGNGEQRGDVQPVNAIIEFPANSLDVLLGNGAAPEFGPVTQYDLGMLDDTPLTFTDALASDGSLLYVAAAEASPDTLHDGPVFGSAIGVIGSQVRWTQLHTRDGVFDGKVEGIARAREAGHVWCLVDRDDPLRATELCLVRLEGDWR